MTRRESAGRGWVRGLLGLSLTVGAAVVVGRSVNALYPMADWLFWRYAVLWAWLVLFSAACASFGQWLLVRGFGFDDLPALESAVLSMVLGTVGFVMVMYAAGTVGLFQPWFAVSLPFALLSFGLPHGIRLGARLRRELGVARFGLVSGAGAIFGIAGLGLTYFRILTPDALGYDASWFYVKSAQDYARWGGIHAFPGDYSEALPHLASLLYTWGYLLPGLHVAHRWVFALHLEMCLLLWTLAGIAALVARQLEPPVPRASWAFFFLFPGSFVFGLWGTGDHITAFFSIGVGLALLRAVAKPSRATFGLLALPIAGGLLTKYQAFYLAVPTVMVALGAWVFTWLRRPRAQSARERSDLLWAPPTLLAVSAALLAPHFLQNIVFYHNPVYPLLQRFFTHSVPSVPNGWLYLEYGMKPEHYVPRGTVLDKLSWALKVVSTPSLLPRSLATAACSLFVLLLPALAFLRLRRFTLILSLVSGSALLLWAMVLFDLRHIETFAPVFIAVTAALAVRLWRLGWLTRLGLVPLLVIELAWGADAAFWDSSLPGINASLNLIHQGLAGKGSAALDAYRADYLALGRAVPRDAKLVIHTFGGSLGIDRDVFMDSIGFQGLIDYQVIHTPRELYDRFRALGVTHLVHEPNGGYASPIKQEDIVFHGLAAQYGVPVGQFGGLFLTELPDTPPPIEAPYRALCIGLDDVPDGLYPIGELRNWAALPERFQGIPKADQLVREDNQALLLQEADAVLRPAKGRVLDAAARELLERRFELIDNRIHPWLLYLKRSNRRRAAHAP